MSPDQYEARLSAVARMGMAVAQLKKAFSGDGGDSKCDPPLREKAAELVGNYLSLAAGLLALEAETQWVGNAEQFDEWIETSVQGRKRHAIKTFAAVEKMLDEGPGPQLVEDDDTEPAHIIVPMFHIVPFDA